MTGAPVSQMIKLKLGMGAVLTSCSSVLSFVYPNLVALHRFGGYGSGGCQVRFLPSAIFRRHIHNMLHNIMHGERYNLTD
jgi:hypothetical protein